MTFRSPAARWLASLALAAAGRGAEGAEGGVEVRRELQENLGGSVNPAGLQNRIDLRWVRPLTTSRRPILQAAHLAVGLSHSLTPSHSRLAFWAEVAPLSILSVRAGAEPAVYFGTFGSLMSFQDYADPFDDETRKAREDQARAGTANRFYLSPRLQMRVGPVVVGSGVDLEWWSSSAEGPWFYEPARDLLLEVHRGRCVRTSSALLRQHDLPRGAGLRYGLVHRFTYVPDAPGDQSQLLGVVLTRDFAGRILGVNRPRLEGEVSYYLDHPSRDGQWTAALGLSFALGH